MMDPDMALSEGMEAVAAIFGAMDAGCDPDPDDARTVATALDALNDWLSRGGFLPKPWHDSRESVTVA